MRDWKPLPAKDLDRILADTEQDCPDGLYTADDVYRLAREVEALRARPKKGKMNFAKVALYLEYIAWELRCNCAPESLPRTKKEKES